MYSDISELDRDELIALAKMDLTKDLIEPALLKLKRAQKLNPAIDQVTALLAKIYAELKLFDRASTLFEQYLETFPGAINDRFQFGMVQLESGSPDTAIQVWNPILENDPTHPPALYYTALALLELNQVADSKRNLNVLLQTTPADNLYFSRSKELLSKIDSNQSLSASDKKLLSDLN